MLVACRAESTFRAIKREGRIVMPLAKNPTALVTRRGSDSSFSTAAIDGQNLTFHASENQPPRAVLVLARRCQLTLPVARVVAELAWRLA